MSVLIKPRSTRKNQKEAVLETYDLASVFGQIAESERANTNSRRNVVRVENDQRLDGERRAARARFEKTEQAAIEAKTASEAELQQLADARTADAADANDLLRSQKYWGFPVTPT